MVLGLHSVQLVMQELKNTNLQSSIFGPTLSLLLVLLLLIVTGTAQGTPCTKKLGNPQGPSMNFPQVRFVDIPQGIFVPEGWPLFRGLNVSFSDRQIEDFFTLPYAHSVSRVRNKETERKLRKKFQLDTIGEKHPNQYGKFVQNHSSGVQQKLSPWLSTSYDIGVATYFSFQGNKSRRLVFHFKAPKNSISIKAFDDVSSYAVDRGEGEVLVPIKIDPSLLIQILEIGVDSQKNAVVIGRWYRLSHQQIIYESVNNRVLPFRRTAVIR